MTLQEHIEKIRNGLETNRFPNEAAVSHGIIPRVLDALGWPRYDTQVVAPEYTVKGRRVDFALCPSPSKPIVFIEVKQVGNIHGSDGQLAERQLFEYALHEGVPIAVLTDGQKWHFFHAPGQRKYKQRKVYELDLLKEDKDESAQRLNRYLNYEAVRNGDATKAIQEDYEQEKIKECLLTAWENLVKGKNEFLGEAWENLVEGKNEFLLHAIAEETEKLSEHKPTEDLVLDFLKNLKIDVMVPSPTLPRLRPDGRSLPTRLVVTLDDGELISYRNASDTFVKVIEKLGIERVRNLRIIEHRIPLISTIKSDRYNPHKSGSYYIVTQTLTKRKKSLLEEIADRLGVSLTIEIVEK